MVTFHKKSRLLYIFPKRFDYFTLGDNVYMRGSFISSRWMNHELKHVEQYNRYGILGFLVRYIYFSIKYGYENNPLEVEARGAE